MVTKRELELESQLMRTRIELIQVQNIMLNNDYSTAKSRLQEIEEELRELNKMDDNIKNNESELPDSSQKNKSSLINC